MTNKLWLGLVKIIGNKSTIGKGGGYDKKNKNKAHIGIECYYQTAESSNTL